MITWHTEDNLTTLEMRQWFPRPRPEVFAFFSNAANLERITPPWLRFHTLTPLPIAMQQGATIDYRLRLRGLPIRWRSEITVWHPPHRFVDEQRRGPYRKWTHEHELSELDGGTEVHDRVRYAVRGGRWIDRLLVRPGVARIFAYRERKLRELLG
jgi:ligand-binding SRPBCC domain-containing protein